MARGSASRLGLLAAVVLGLHLMLLQGWSPRAPAGGSPPPPGLSVRLMPEAVTSPAAPAPAVLPARVQPRSGEPPHPPQASPVQPTPDARARPSPPADRPAAASPPPATAATDTPSTATAASTVVTASPPGLLAAIAPTVVVPPPARWRYEVTGSARGLPVQGEARLDWQHDGQQYEARMEWGGDGLPARSHRSSGRLTAEGLQPRRFSERQRSELATHLDAEGGRIVFSGNQPPQPHLPGQQDRLSLLVQVAALIGGDPARYPPGARLSIPTATARGAEPWLLEVTGAEDLTLAGGVVRTLKIERRPVGAHDQRVEIWLAPAAAHAPVRLRVTQAGGDWLDQRWHTPDGR